MRTGNLTEQLLVVIVPIAYQKVAKSLVYSVDDRPVGQVNPIGESHEVQPAEPDDCGDTRTGGAGWSVLLLAS